MARIPEETVRQIIESNDIVEVVGGYLPLKRAGTNFVALCPFHREKTPSFHVNPSRQLFRCFGCGAGGSVVRFVMDFEGMEFLPALRKLAERVGIAIQEQDQGESSGHLSALKHLHGESAQWFHNRLMRGSDAQAARDYLKRRGIDAEVARAWQIGYAPESWDALVRWAQGKGFAAPLLIESGLAKPRSEGEEPKGLYDRFRNRVMFPIRNESGEVLAFSGRTLFSDESVPKYVNSPETAIFTKGKVLFGLDKSRRAIVSAGKAVLLEGQIDLITCFSQGIENVAAPQGTAFTLAQARVLKRLCSEVVVCFDADEAGQKAAEKCFGPLTEVGVSLRVAELPPGEDPDSLIRVHGATALITKLAEAPEFIDFFLARIRRRFDLATGKGRLDAADAVADLLQGAPDPVLRETVLLRASSALQIGRDAIEKRLRSARNYRVIGETKEKAPRRKRLQPGEAVNVLCRAALHSQQALDYLRSEDLGSVLEELPDSEPLAYLLAQPVVEPALLTARLDQMGRDDLSGYFLEIMALPPPENAPRLVGRWLEELKIRLEIDRRSNQIQTIASSIAPSFETMARLKKEIVDLRRRLANLPSVVLSDETL